MTTFKLHKFQEQAFVSKKRVVVIAAGIQSGKTTTGALWLGAKSGQAPPDSNLIICAPTYKILTQATLPKFLSVFKGFGKYHKVDSIFRFKNGVTAYIRSLTDPNALEGITDVEAIWLDEGGLISRYAWENVEGRSAFRQAPILISTTPYALNWLFRMWEEWSKGLRDEVEFIQFSSKDNPHFPDEEYERQRRLLDSRRFQMKYMGQFGKMEGLVYETINYCKSHKLPSGTRYYAGIDFGYTNPTAIVIRALTPDGIHYRVAEFYKSGMMIEEIASVCAQRKQIYNIELFVADPSAPANIEALNRAGVPCIPANNEVRAGIDEQSLLFKQGKFFIFEDDCKNGVDEYSTYHYPEPKDYKIDEDVKEPEPVKSNDHGCFRRGTVVSTPRGQVPIEEIEVGDVVCTPFGSSKVLKAGVTGVRKLVEVVFRQESSVYCTEDHPFYQPGKGFSKAEVGGIVWVRNIGSSTEKSILGEAGTGAAQQERGSYSIGTFGNIIVERFLRVLASTIRIAIRTITIFQIFRSLLRANIRKSIQTKFGSGLQPLSTSKCYPSGDLNFRRLQTKLVAHQKEEGDQVRLLKEQQQICPWFRMFAYSAKRRTSESQLSPNIARKLVSRVLDAAVVMIKLRYSVLSAVSRFLRINIAKKKLVTIDAVRGLRGVEEEVYNLTTEVGCYYANNILVSNCDADRYVTMHLSKANPTYMAHDPGPRKMPDDVIKRLEWLKRGGSARFGT